MANCKAREIPGCRQMLLCSKEILTKCCEGGTRQIRLIQQSLKLKACGSSRLLICPWPKLAFAELIIVGGHWTVQIYHQCPAFKSWSNNVFGVYIVAIL